MPKTLDEALAIIREAGDNPKLPVPKRWNPKMTLLPYQRVGASHLVTKTRYVLGDPCGTGKTPQELYAWGVISDHRPLRLMVLTTKSATYQWADEVDKFLPGTTCFVVPSTKPSGAQAVKQDRIEMYQRWIKAGPGAVIVMNWTQLMNDWEWLSQTTDQWADHTHLTLDEIQKIKNPETKLATTLQNLITIVPRVHGLTATLVKNKAHDALAIINALVPGFMSEDYFDAKYCTWGTKRIRKKGYRGAITVKDLQGYKDLPDFGKLIVPYYLARADDEIEVERPDVVHVTRRSPMNAKHRKIYLEAEKGMFLNTKSNRPEETAGAGLVHAQLAANSPELFPGKAAGLADPMLHPEYEATSKNNTKLSMLKDLLDVELEGLPVVIYSPLKTTINSLEHHLKHLNPVRITGDENDEQRAEARRKFTSGETNVIFLTDAGGEALNLQTAAHLILYSRPWDPGRYVQIVGRIRRFGSKFKKITLWHLTMDDTVDEFVDATVTNKFGPYDQLVQDRGGMMPSAEMQPMEVVRMARRIRLNS
jgi:superfamily II DNA or RNA helicase